MKELNERSLKTSILSSVAYPIGLLVRRKSALFLAFSLMVWLLAVPVGVIACGQNPTLGTSLGVRVGDWAEYRVERWGGSATWGLAPWREAERVSVKIQAISDTAATIQWTMLLKDGSQTPNRTVTEDLKNVWLGDHYLLASNLTAGDKIAVEEWVDLDHDNSVLVEELYINATVSRNYGETTRETNWLKWSYLRHYHGRLDNFTQEYYWDRQTGLLVERTWQEHDQNYYENASIPTLWLQIVDTNLWKIEAERQSLWIQWAPWVALGMLAAGGTITGLVVNRYKKKEG